ncbi:MAG: helix-turn-helix transcriptional regulator [Oscillospiraceae bacterium]|nr:helix-turn-helix transcriptional regulator [Oscillospiraceae bacterium]
MISYEPLWKTMKRKGATTYTLQVKGGISSSTVRRLKAGQSVSTNTIDALCAVLCCKVDEIVEFVSDEK